MKIVGGEQEAYPSMSPLVLGAVLLSQGGSIHALKIHVDLPTITGADSAILVSTYPDYLFGELALRDDCLLTDTKPCADDASRLRHSDHSLEFQILPWQQL